MVVHLVHLAVVAALHVVARRGVHDSWVGLVVDHLDLREVHVGLEVVDHVG